MPNALHRHVAAAALLAAASLASLPGCAGFRDRSADPEPERVERVVRDSGLIIEDLRVGSGDICMPGTTVTVHYTGTLLDGTVFDSTDPDGEPATFDMNQLIRGWQEGIPGMRVGGIRRLTIPALLAYRDEERTDADGNVVIPANSDLIFEIELLGVDNE